MAVFKRMALKQGNATRTNAAELTLRASLYPIMLVTVLFFLWVSASSQPPNPNAKPNPSIGDIRNPPILEEEKKQKCFPSYT